MTAEAVAEDLPAVVADARLRDDPFGVAALQSSPTSRLPEAVYPYYAEDGSHLYDVVRFEAKNFRYRHYDHRGRFVWNAQGIRRVPYRLPQLIEAVARGETVYIVEGEKDADAVAAAGGAATTNPGGAGKWRDQYSAYLLGANVVVVADRGTDVERRHAREVAASVLPVAASVSLVQAREGKDAADHLAAGFGLADLEPLSVSRDDLRRVRLATLDQRRRREWATTSRTRRTITDAPVSRRDSLKWASDRWTALGLVDGRSAGEYDAALSKVIKRDPRTCKRVRTELLQAGLIEVQKEGRRRLVTLTEHGEAWRRAPFPRFAKCLHAYARTARGDRDGEVVPLPFEPPTNPLVRSGATGGFDALDFLHQLGATNVARVGDVVEFSCMHHDDRRPSGSMRVEGLAWQCFACGRSGGADDLLAELEGVTPIIARRWISETYGIEPATDPFSRKQDTYVGGET